MKFSLAGAIPRLMTNLTDYSDRPFAIAALMTDKTVRSLIFSTLLECPQGVTELVQICRSSSARASFTACMAVSLLMLDPKNHIPLLEADVIGALTSFCGNARPIDYSHGMPLNVDSLPPFFDLLTSPFPALRQFFAILLAVVVYRSLHMSLASPALFYGQKNPFVSESEEGDWGENDRRATEQRHRGALLLKTSVIPRLRILSVDESLPIRSIAWDALTELNETEFVGARSLSDFCDAVEGNAKGASVLEKILSSEDMEIHHLIRSLDGQDWAVVFAGLKVKKGTLTRMIAVGKRLSEILRNERKRIASVEMDSFDDLDLTSESHSVTSDSSLSQSMSSLSLSTEMRSSVTPLPQVFLSYSWANQAIVKRIKKTFESEGIRCWMDLEAMCGGQSLFEEIDRGVSQCVVFVSCLSPSYGSSKNCQREIQLAIDRQKVIIPIWVMSISQWPPSGSMGPLLAGKLYIDMSDDEKYRENLPHLLHSVKSSLSSC